MKRMLCYGDSNTWGYDPVSQRRFDDQTRWTGILKTLLAREYTIIEEGLNGRTTVWQDPIEGYKNGREYLIPCLESQWPLDLVVMMLGTNDLKRRFNLSAFDIAESVGALVQIAKQIGVRVNGSAPQVLLMAPPPVGKLTLFADMFEGAEAKSRQLGNYYRRVADAQRCAFFDTSSVIVSSDVDGIHFDKSEHAKLAQAVATKVRELYS